MSNSCFEFQQFCIRQDKCAMKVGTDGVLLGAWVNPAGCRRILDIGTGSGLIALMLAQRGEADIDAVEIVEEAAIQAVENIVESRWSQRIRVHHSSIQDFCRVTSNKYDLVVSNPPFFDSGKLADDNERALARHNKELSIIELISCSAELISEKGKIALILPFDMRERLITVIAQYGLWIEKEVKVIPVPGKPVVRLLFLLSTNSAKTREVDEIIIEDNGRHQYSAKFRNLTSKYYKFLE